MSIINIRPIQEAAPPSMVRGILFSYPGSGAETYKMAYNSISTIAALKTILSRLLELPESTSRRKKKPLEGGSKPDSTHCLPRKRRVQNHFSRMDLGADQQSGDSATISGLSLGNVWHWPA
jgi:hypothetical protein